MKKTSSCRQFIFVFGVVTTTLILDYYTKDWIRDSFPFGARIPVIKDFFDLAHFHNTGAAFGFLSDTHPTFRSVFFSIVLITAIIVLIVMLLKTAQQDVLKQSALSLVLGGAIGNAINRLELGHVTDFLSFHYGAYFEFPAFNIADIAICMGVGLLILFGSDRQRKDQHSFS